MQLTTYFYLYKSNKNFGLINNWSYISKNLYNQGLYLIKKYYEDHKNDEDFKPLGYNDLDKILRTTINLEGDINYKLLPAVTSQQILKLLDQNIRSFYSSIKDWKLHPNKYLGQPKFPSFLKNKKYLLIFLNQRSHIKNGILQLTKNCKIELPKFIKINDFNQIRIVPVTRDRFKVEIIYTVEEQPLKEENGKYLGIDLGINNFATCLSTLDKKPFILDGRCIKSENKHYNIRRNYLKSILWKQNKFNSKNLEELEFKRFCKIQDIFHLYSKRIIDYCLNNEINTIIIGKNKNWKQKVNIGRKNNETFIQIPHAKFIYILKYKCQLYGINFIETEESYTSKSDNLIGEPLTKDCSTNKRIRRGLYLSDYKNGAIINADINGAIGILRKIVFSDIHLEIRDRGNLFLPIRLKHCRIKNKSYFNDLFL